MQFELTREYIDDLRKLIDQKNETEIKAKIEYLHPADIADILDELNTEEAIYIFLRLDADTGVFLGRAYPRPLDM